MPGADWLHVANESKHPFSVHTGVKDKPEEAFRRNLGKGWEPVEMTEADVAECVREGWAIAPQFREGRRRTNNFIRSGFLAADVDTGMTLGEATDHPFVQHHGGLIHTTVSHTADHNRFRIIFLTQEPITIAQDWADAQLGLAVTLDSDRSVSDAARAFFGNTRAAIYPISKSMPSSVVTDLIALGRDTRAQSASLNGRMPVDSVRQMGPGALIKLANGSGRRMDELTPRMSVHCPYHNDTNPSAFVVPSSNGAVLGIYCSACKVTFWPDNKRDAYDFDAFDRLFETRRHAESPTNDDAVGFDKFFPPKPKFLRSADAFLSPIDYAPGITMVKSAKGSGKTVALEAMILAIRARVLPAISDRPKKILLIGHRRTLIREAARKLGLRCYMDADDGDADGFLTLAVCLDSLPRYAESFAPGNYGPGWKRKGPFDLVIIDEVEQVLKHLMSKTIEDRAGLERCYDALAYEVTHAKSVIALDADLGLLTAHVMKALRPNDWEANCRIIYNARIESADRRTMRLFRDRKRLEREVIDAIRHGQRCFITSNSKAFINTMERMIRNECGENIVMRVITGDNSQEDAVIDFVKNIRTKFLLVQVVLASPSMGTGVDITFQNGECHVDRVFGFFYPMVNAHTDIDQQLCRVRNPGAVDVWISGTTFNYTCNVEVVKDDLARAYTVKRAVKGRRPDGMIDYDPEDPLLLICAHVTALERASKNRLVELFCRLREASGWDIDVVLEKSTKSPFEEARRELQEERQTLLLDAPKLSSDDIIDMDLRKSRGDTLSAEDRAAYEKYQFEREVGIPLYANLIALNFDGRLVERVRTLSDLASFWSKTHLMEGLLERTRQKRGRLPKIAPAYMIGVLLRIAGLATETGFNTDAVVSTRDLREFSRVCRENQTTIEEIFVEQLRSDLEKKPTTQLGRFLKRIGLSLVLTKTENFRGRKVRQYAIDRDTLLRMMTLAESLAALRAQREDERLA